MLGELRKVLEEYVKYAKTKNTTPVRRGWTDASNSDTPSSVIQFSIGPVNREFHYVDSQGKESIIPLYKHTVSLEWAKKTLTALGDQPANIQGLSAILSKCYNLVFTQNPKKIMTISAKPNDYALPANPPIVFGKMVEVRYAYFLANSEGMNTDLRKSTVMTDIDELHLRCGCEEHCNCPFLNLPKIIPTGSKFTLVYPSGNKIDITSVEMWENYLEIKPCYTHECRYFSFHDGKFIVHTEQYLSDLYPDTTHTGFWYRLDDKKVLVTKMHDHNYRLTPSVIPMMDVSKITFITSDVKNIEQDAAKLKELFGQDKKIKSIITF